MTTGLLPANPVRAVIIGLDGTMVDTAGDLRAVINAIPEALDATPGMSSEEVVGYIGKDSEDLTRRVPGTRLPPAQVNSCFAEGLEAYQCVYIAINGKYVNVYEGVRGELAALYNMGLTLACVTNKPYDFTQLLPAQLGLSTYLDPVYPGDAFQYRKPDPYPTPWVAGAFGMAPAEIVAIGGFENDVRTAHAAGMCVLTVPYGYNHGQPMQGAGADIIIGTLFTAAELIRPYAESHNAISVVSN